MLQSIRLLADAARSFTDNCVVGIRADEARIRELMQRSLMLVTALAPEDRLRQGRRRSPRPRMPTARRCARKPIRLGYLTGEEFDRLVQPEQMTRPG